MARWREGCDGRAATVGVRARGRAGHALRTGPREHGLWVGLDVRQRSLSDDEAGKERVRVDDDGTAAREPLDHWDPAALRRLDVQHLLGSTRDAQHHRLGSGLRAIPLVRDEPAPSVGAKQRLLELQHAQDGHVAQLQPERARPRQPSARHGRRQGEISERLRPC